MPSRRRPRSVTALALAALVVSALGFSRMALAFGLAELPLAVSPAYLAVAGGAWGAIGLAVGLGLLFGIRRAPAFTRAATLTMVGWYWADRLLLGRSDYLQRSWPAAAALSALLTVAAMWILRRPTARAYFGEISA